MDICNYFIWHSNRPCLAFTMPCFKAGRHWRRKIKKIQDGQSQVGLPRPPRFRLATGAPRQLQFPWSLDKWSPTSGLPDFGMAAGGPRQLVPGQVVPTTTGPRTSGPLVAWTTCRRYWGGGHDRSRNFQMAITRDRESYGHRSLLTQLGHICFRFCVQRYRNH